MKVDNDGSYALRYQNVILSIDRLLRYYHRRPNVADVST